jgi:hypothetical protein
LDAFIAVRMRFLSNIADQDRVTLVEETWVQVDLVASERTIMELDCVLRDKALAKDLISQFETLAARQILLPLTVKP